MDEEERSKPTPGRSLIVALEMYLAPLRTEFTLEELEPIARAFIQGWQAGRR